MIRLRRPPEPEALRARRSWRVGRGLWLQECATDGYNLPEVRRALVEAQHGRCAYCGAEVEERGSDIEHFRPRALYWWLTWTWENLWLSCRQCQVKGGDFPLTGGSSRLGAPTSGAARTCEAFELWREQPMLLDPERDDPHEHLEFVCAGSPRTWCWTGVSLRGAETLRILQRTRAGRTCATTRIEDQIQRYLEPDCKELLRELDASPPIDLDGVQRLWDKLQDTHFYPGAVYRDALWWYVRQRFSDEALQRAGLMMFPYPDDNPAPAPAWTINHDHKGCSWPAEFDEGMQWLVRYVRNGTAPREHLHAALNRICARRPSTTVELAGWLDRTERTIGEHLEALVKCGRLTPRPDGRYGAGAARADSDFVWPGEPPRPDVGSVLEEGPEEERESDEQGAHEALAGSVGLDDVDGFAARAGGAGLDDGGEEA